MEKKFSLKDALFNPTKVSKISSEIKGIYKNFEEEKFKEEVLSKFPELELKERIYHIRDMLKKYLPHDFQESTTILLKSLPPELDNSKKDDDFGDFIYAPYSEYVRAFGCTEKYLDFSLIALREMTTRFSVEFSIRDFINIFPKETLEMLRECSLSVNYHQRRLASEGLRLNLPWAKKIDIDYREALNILENLYYDTTRYVTRSVANHMNDISKIDPSVTLKILKRWKLSNKQEAKEMEFIINHSLRSLIKNGDKDTLEFLGYSTSPSIKIKNFKLNQKNILIGEYLEFSFDIEVEKDEKLIIDYILYFRTKSGSLSPKVHKIKKLVLDKNSTFLIKKRHLFKENMSTRKFYEGEHKIELQINGEIYESNEFELSIS